MHIASARVAVAKLLADTHSQQNSRTPDVSLVAQRRFLTIGVSPRFRPLTAFQLYVTYGLGLALELALGCYRGRVAALRSFVNLCCHASVERVAEASNWASLWARRGLRSRRFTIFPEVPSLRPMRIVYTMTHIKGEL